MKRRTAASTFLGLLASAVCLPAKEGKMDPGKPGTPPKHEDTQASAAGAIAFVDRAANNFSLTPLSQLEDGCVYALLVGGFAGYFVEVIRFTKWERVLVTTRELHGVDTTLFRRQGLKGGTLIADKRVNEILAASNNAIDAPLPPDRVEMAGDDMVYVFVARKDKGKFTYRARVFVSDEFLEPEMYRVMALLLKFDNDETSRAKKPATP